MTITDEEVEALARAFCREAGLDPDAEGWHPYHRTLTRVAGSPDDTLVWCEDWRLFRGMAFDRIAMDRAVKALAEGT